MWGLFVFVSLISWTLAGGQSRGVRQQSHTGPGWDIRLAVPGDPGSDYPTLGNIPRTSFSCSGKAPGYYADIETNCQAFRVCTSGSTYGFQSFLCPNGTLFNQAVFVCDWWMNVNCQKSQEFITNNNDKFGNLRLGPQLMKDVKKMITHSMRNPYDKTIMKSNLIVMQEYKPPVGQMYMTGSLILSPVRAPNSVYVPAKQIQQPYNGYSNGNVFAASTPSPTYVPPAFNSISLSQRDAEVFQRQRQNGQYQQSQRQNGQYQQVQRQNEQYQQNSQRQNGQYQQNSQRQNSQYQNGQYHQSSQNQGGQYQSGQYQQSQRQNGQYQQSSRLQSTQTSQIRNGHAGQFSQNQVSSFTNSYNNKAVSRPTQLYTPAQYRQNNLGNTQTFGQTYQNGQYTDGRTQSQQYNGKQSTEIGVSFSKQQYANNPRPASNTNTGQIHTEAKENLVSEETPATIITKTLTFNKIVDPEPGKPKSRITIKTWIVKPTKSAKLIAEPTSYNYARPTNPPSEKQVAEAPYVYNPPTTERITEQEGPYSYDKPTVAKQVEGPYVYNKPTVSAKQVEGPYVYNKPTVSAKQIVTTPSRLYLTPTSPPPTLSRLYLSPTTAPPTVASKLYLPPTTYKPASKLYLPPVQPDVILSRQYLSPNSISQSNYQSEKLQASPTSPSPVYVAYNNENPSFSLTKHSHINANHNNLTFADILTKEKLDITVNDIVSDTSKVLKTASPQLEQYNQDKSVDYIDESYIQSDGNENESGENLTPQSPTVLSTSSRLIQGPSVELEPPVETFDHNQEAVNTNRLANLPFYKDPPTNTIERTVSLKISIPEKVASYLFKNRSDSDYDKLEILNTGSSNYLVLTNNLLNKSPGASFIPIGRLIADKTNISDSQALVFNFLADSLNAAREYSTIAKQNIVAPTPAQFQTVDNQQLARITNQISQLTASQYANQNNYQPNTVSAQSNQYQQGKYTNGYAQTQQQNSAPARLTQGYAYQNSGLNNNQQVSQNQIYSGQLYKLPVPDVTSQIYNVGANYVQNGQQSTASNGVNLPKHSSAEVEIVQSQTLPIAPAKLQQFTPSNEAETFNSQEHSAQALLGNFLNNGNGISAQLQDKVVGTIPHPSEDNKFVTYKKDQSYHIYTKLNSNAVGNGQVNNNQGNQNAKLVQNNAQNLLFQFVPSVSYQLEDEKEQQKILNAFQIDEYGSPKKVNQVDQGRRHDLLSEVDYSVEHPHSAKQVEGNEINTLYTGPSSYSAPQASVGSLEVPPPLPNNLNARLELDENNGYGKVTPARQFNF